MYVRRKYFIKFICKLVTSQQDFFEKLTIYDVFSYNTVNVIIKRHLDLSTNVYGIVHKSKCFQNLYS